MENLSVVVFIVIAFFVLAWYAVKVVRQYDRLVVFRLGRVIGAKGPGLVWLWPFIDQATRVDLREQFLEIPSQTTITRDNAPIAVDFLIYWRVMNPEDSVVAVRDFAGASQGIATTTLRAVIGDIPLDDVLAKRDQINQLLQVKLDEVTERWGVKVTAVEIREITPPRDIQDAMNRQMAAERNRRATVTEAEGHRQATVTVAEGDKSATVLKAEGDRQAAILRAEGFSLALGQIFSVARTVDERLVELSLRQASLPTEDRSQEARVGGGRGHRSCFLGQHHSRGSSRGGVSTGRRSLSPGGGGRPLRPAAGVARGGRGDRGVRERAGQGGGGAAECRRRAAGQGDARDRAEEDPPRPRGQGAEGADHVLAQRDGVRRAGEGQGEEDLGNR